MDIFTEFNNAFDLEYQSASNQAPDINMYEKSYFFTKANDKLITDSIQFFDKNETSKRLLQPLLVQNHECSFDEVQSELPKFRKFKVSYPTNFRALLRMTINTNNCSGIVINKEDRLDNINETYNNPFRQPNKRRVVKVLGEVDGQVKFDYIYTSKDTTILNIHASYIKYNKPIVLMDFDEDPTAIGDESIRGYTTKTMTDLEQEFHPSIIKGAVIYAVESLRTNTLNTKLNL